MMKKIVFLAAVAVATTVSARTIAYWPFGAKGLADASGNGNDLEADANVTVRETAAMNGAQKLFSTVNALDLSDCPAVTVEFWTRFNAADNSGARLFLEFTELTGGNSGGFYIDYGEAAGAVMGMLKITGDSGAEENPVVGLGDGQWHHIAFVINPKLKSEACTTLYVDKTHVYTHCTKYPNANSWGNVAFPSNKKLYVGSRANSSLQFTGEIDNLRVSNAALTPAEFVNLDGSVPTPAPLAYWPFGSAGATDMSGNGHDLQIGAAGASLTNGALNFNGAQADTFTRLPVDLSVCTNGLTTEFWMRAPAGKAGAQVPFEVSHDANYHVAGRTGFFCALNDSFNKMYFNALLSDGYQMDVDKTTDVQDDVWHHVAYVVDPRLHSKETCLFYLDGVLQGQSAGYLATNLVGLAKEHLYLGSRFGRKCPYVGDLDDVRLTPAALTTEQFMTARTGEDAAVLGHWTFNRGAETVNARGSATLSADGVTYANGAAELDGSSAWTTSALSLEGAATVECFFSADGTWHHLVKVYGDGIAAAPTSTTVDGEAAESALLTFDAGVLRIAGTGFTGRIDDVRVTAAALSASDWLASRTDDTPVVLNRWSFDSLAQGCSDFAGANPIRPVSNSGEDCGLYDRALRLVHSAGLRTDRPLRLSHWPALTIEWFGRTSQASAGNFLELGTNFNNQVGRFCASTSFMGDGSPGAGFRTSGGYDIRATAKGVSTSDGTWHRYAYVLDRSGGTLKTAFYVDGVAQENRAGYSSAADTAFADDYLMVGARYGTFATYDGYASYVGDIDEIRIVNGALAPSEQLTAADRAAQDPVTVAHWRFDGEKPLEDRSGNGYDLTGTATVADGAAVFSGSTSLQTAKDLVLSGCRQVTVEAVFRTDDPEATGILFETSPNYGTNPGSISCYYNGEGDFYGRIDCCTRGLAWTSDSACLRDTRWHHVAMQMDMDVTTQDRIRYWVDGVLVRSYARMPASAALANDTTFGDYTFYLGARAGNSFFMTGQVKEIRVTSGLLAPSEFLERPAPETDEKGIVAYWPFTRTADWRTDETGHGYELSTSGAGVTQVAEGGYVSFAANHDALETSTRIDFAKMEKFTLEAFVRPTVSRPLGVMGTCTWSVGTSSHVPGLLFATGTNTTGGVDLQGSVTIDAFCDKVPRWHSLFVSAGANTYDAKDGWHHVALVVDRTAGANGRISYYCDRKAVREENAGARPDFVPLRLAVGGLLGDIPSARFVGDIDDVRITAAALTPDEMLRRRSSNLGLTVIVR